MLEKPPPFQKAEEVTHAGADHELSPHSELAKQAIDFFEADVQRILTEIEAGEAHFFGSTDRVTVRCFMLVNPEKADDVPIFLTRPSIALSATEFKDNTGRMYNLGEYIDNTIHSEIWYYWEQLIREDPSSERAAFFQKLDTIDTNTSFFITSIFENQQGATPKLTHTHTHRNEKSDTAPEKKVNKSNKIIEQKTHAIVQTST